MTKRNKPLLLRVLEVTSLDAKGGSTRTVRADSIHSADKKHENLTLSQQEEADQLFHRIGRLFSPNKGEWRDGFLYDQHPDRELRVWKHIANVVDYLWYEEPKVLKLLKRDQLARLVTLVSSRVVDIPAHLPDVTDKMVDLVTYVYTGNLLDHGEVVEKPSAASRSREKLVARITVDPAVCHGKPTIRHMRYPVETIVELIDSGMTFEEILSDYPDLEEEDLVAAIQFSSPGEQDRRLQLVTA